MFPELQSQIPDLRERLLALSRDQKCLLQILVDTLLIWTALWLAFFIRLDDASKIEPLRGHAWLFILAPLLAIPLFARFGLYRAVMRYFGNQAFTTIVKAVSPSSRAPGRRCGGRQPVSSNAFSRYTSEHEPV